MRDDLEALPSHLYHGERIRQLEPLLAEQLGLSLYQVMEEAGRQLWLCVQRHWPKANRLLVIAGRGNNGGDGFVLARIAAEAGRRVHMLQVEPERLLSGDAALAKQAYLTAGGDVGNVDDVWPEADLIVDGLLGSGLRGTLSPTMGAIIERINGTRCPVLSIDVPSGVNGDNGAVTPIAVKADVTLTLVGAKPALLTGAGAAHCGRLELAPLQIGQALNHKAPSVIKCSLQDFESALKPRSLDSHKGDHGRLLMVGGDLGMAGAIRIAAEGSLRAGAGLVKVVSQRENMATIQSGRPELMAKDVDETTSDTTIKEIIRWADVVAIGPGLGQEVWGQRLLDLVVRQSQKLLVDADGLNGLARKPSFNDSWVLTPHPGEAGRLLGWTTEQVQSNRFEAIAEIQRRFGGVTVLKGPGTLIYDGEQMYVAPVGNPGLASGGSGDLLSGIIAALIAQGMSLLQAACCGVCVHGEAADKAAQLGQRGMLASDLLPFIRELVNP